MSKKVYGNRCFLFPARKINIGKFQHKKTNVMVVTDVAVSEDVPFMMSLRDSLFLLTYFFSTPFEREGGRDQMKVWTYYKS